MATTVRVSEATRARAAALAARRGRSIGEIVDEALEALETAEFWRKTQEALSRHPVELDEDSVWELSVADGLDRE
jgi:predicted transcriptional regulator